MWTFDNPPTEAIQLKYDFTLTKQWLDHVRLSSVRFNDGGSGSFVSSHGLVLTNHHVARGQLQKNSTAEHDYVRDGFYAATPDEEMKSTDLEVNVLVSTENVTERVQNALKPSETPEEQFQTRHGVIAQIERESTEKTGLRSDVVTLYGGGEYWLYRYKKYPDVRLVFAPEMQASYFGGDPDNFTFPRHDLDMALFRIYENGKPIDSSNYLKWNPKGADEGELVFVNGHLRQYGPAGHAGTTRVSTGLSIAQCSRLAEKPDRNPRALFRDQSRARARSWQPNIFPLQRGEGAHGNARRPQEPPHHGNQEGRRKEVSFRSEADASLKAKYGNAWDELATVVQKQVPRVKERFYRSTDSRLSALAADIVDYVAEIKKPDAERLPAFHDAELESLRYEMLSPAPIYDDMEIASITGALHRGLNELSPNDPFLKIVLNGKTPEQAAADLVHGSKLQDPKLRKALIDGGQAAVDASTDSMTVLNRKLDPLRRESI